MQRIHVNNLAHLKRLFQVGAQYRTLRHAIHPDYVGLIRVVSTVQGNAVYSKIKDQPNHRLSNCNHGKGVRTDFEKASRYRFGDTVEVLDKKGEFMYEFEVLADE